MRINREFDYPPVSAVKESYIICSAPRTGSTLLSRGLWATNLAGAPKEYLNPTHIGSYKKRIKKTQKLSTVSFLQYFTFILKVRTSPNGVFGIKTHYEHFQTLLNNGKAMGLLGDIKYVFISRKDKLRQAISWLRAQQTKQWTSEHPLRSIPEYDHHRITELIDSIHDLNRNWEEFSKTIPAEKQLHYTYEYLCSNFPLVLSEILAFLNIELPEDFQLPQSPELQKLSDSTTEEWIQRYTREAGAEYQNFR